MVKDGCRHSRLLNHEALKLQSATSIDVSAGKTGKVMSVK